MGAACTSVARRPKRDVATANSKKGLDDDDIDDLASQIHEKQSAATQTDEAPPPPTQAQAQPLQAPSQIVDSEEPRDASSGGSEVPADPPQTPPSLNPAPLDDSHVAPRRPTTTVVVSSRTGKATIRNASSTSATTPANSTSTSTSTTTPSPSSSSSHLVRRSAFQEMRQNKFSTQGPFLEWGSCASFRARDRDASHNRPPLCVLAAVVTPPVGVQEAWVWEIPESLRPSDEPTSRLIARLPLNSDDVGRDDDDDVGVGVDAADAGLEGDANARADATVDADDSDEEFGFIANNSNRNQFNGHRLPGVFPFEEEVGMDDDVDNDAETDEQRTSAAICVSGSGRLVAAFSDGDTLHCARVSPGEPGVAGLRS